ncbi:MAG: T9SS type A sorting domain-containing protein, partial [Luteibaculum sp.]
TKFIYEFDEALSSVGKADFVKLPKATLTEVYDFNKGNDVLVYFSDDPSEMEELHVNGNPEIKTPLYSDLIEHKGWWYFFTKHNGRFLLIKTLGTPENTFIVEYDVKFGEIWPSEIIGLGDYLFAVEGEFLLRINLTNGEVKRIMVNGSFRANSSKLTVFKGKLYFEASTNKHGAELWYLNPSEENAALFKDFVSGSEGSYLKHLVSHNGKLFFVVNTDTFQHTVMATDGSPDDLQILGDLSNHFADERLSFLFGNSVGFYFRHKGSSSDRGIFVTDGTAEGSAYLDISKENYRLDLPSTPIVFKNQLLFSASTLSVGRELFIVRNCASNFDATINKTQSSLNAKLGYDQYQWYDCSTDLPIPGETSFLYSPGKSGSYAVEIAKDGCKMRTPCVAFSGTNTGLDQLNQSIINIYPNPTDGLLQVRTTNPVQTLKLYDSMGKEILALEDLPKEFELDLRKYSRGIFLLQIESSEGIISRKIQIK